MGRTQRLADCEVGHVVDMGDGIRSVVVRVTESGVFVMRAVRDRPVIGHTGGQWHMVHADVLVALVDREQSAKVLGAVGPGWFWSFDMVVIE